MSDEIQAEEAAQELRERGYAKPAEREFNFDQIFTGSDEEQVARAAFFVEGIEAIHKDYAAMYAEDVLNDNPKKATQTEQKLCRLERGLDAFNLDKRGIALEARVKRAALHRSLDRMLR